MYVVNDDDCADDADEMSWMCSDGRCPSVPFVQHAEPNTSVALRGTVVHYHCDVGYEPHDGLMNVVCDGYSWSSLTGYCTGKYLLLVLFYVCVLYVDRI